MKTRTNTAQDYARAVVSTVRIIDTVYDKVPATHAQFVPGLIAAALEEHVYQHSWAGWTERDMMAIVREAVPQSKAPANLGDALAALWSGGLLYAVSMALGEFHS